MSDTLAQGTSEGDAPCDGDAETVVPAGATDDDATYAPPPSGGPDDPTFVPSSGAADESVRLDTAALSWGGDLDRVGALARLLGKDERRYEVRGELGRGGMGKVLRVADGDLNREVAMKVLFGGRDQEKALRFVEEAQINSQLEHPSVLSVHDVGIDAKGDLFFTMQLIPSHETVRDVISKLKAGDPEALAEYSFERRVQIVQQVCHALHYAHGRGVIHRDIKPENIVLGQHGEVWLVDWGIARLMDEEQPAGEPVKVATTADGSGSQVHDAGAWVGTPRYMAPEQILGLNEDVDARTDVYALTAVLYELLTLRHYLGARGQRLADLVEAVPFDPVRDAESFTHPLNGRVPRHLSRFCRKGLAKDKEDRWQSALELERALQSWVEGNAPVVCPGTAIQRGLTRYIRWIDSRPVLLPALTITFGILGLVWVIFASVWTLSGL